MGTVKKHINKLLAVFLCACLLISYNPAFGAVDAAFADDAVNDGGTHIDNGFSQDELDAMVADSAADPDATQSWDRNKPGNMTTIIEASTFDSTLRSSAREPFSATIEQLKAGKVGDTDVSYVWVEVTGGIPHENMDPYDSIWEVFVDDEENFDLSRYFWDGEFISWTVDNDVANYHVDVQAMAKAGLLENDHKYTFVGAFEDSRGGSVIARVTLYTVDNSVVRFKHQIIPGKPGTDLENSEIEGMISIAPKPELIGGKVPDTNPVKEAMEQEAAKNTVEGSDGGNYVVGPVLQIGTSPATIYDENGLEIPPYYEDGFILRLALDPQYEYDEETNPVGYKEGDTITVFWSGDDTGKVVPVTATIVRGDDKVLRAEVPYPYAGDKDGDGMDDTGWPPLPGYFAIQYDTNKLPDTGGDDGDDKPEVGYFSITTSVTGNGIVTPEGTKYWRVNAGESTGSALEAGLYAFAPMGFGEQSYELKTLTLTCTSGSQAGTTYDFLGSDDVSAAGMLTGLNTTLLLTNAPEVFAPDSQWTLTVAFGESTMSPDDGKNSHKLKVSSNKGDFGKVLVGYYDGSRQLKLEPESGTPSASVEVTMLNSSKATVIMMPSSPKDGKYYEVTGVSMKVGDGELELQALTKPFVVPATTEDVEVVVTFEEFTQTGLGGEATYEATAMVDDDDMDLGAVGNIDGDGDFTAAEYVTHTFKEGSAFIPTFVFQGAEEGKHLSSVEVFVGEREACERVDVNAAGDQTYFLVLPNYHDDVRIVGHFVDAYAPTIQLSIVVQTEGEEADAGGEYSTLAWTLPEDGLVRNNQRCPLLITPNTGYVLSSVTENKAGTVSQLRSEVTGGVLEYVAVDGRLDTSEPLPITLTITFKKAENGGGIGDNAVKNFSRLNMYVANPSLAQEGSGLTYIFNDLQADKFTNDVVGQDPATAIAVDGYAVNTGSVNGQQSLFDTVKYGASYPMNLVGATGGEQSYNIQKVLVVTYYYGKNDDGVQVKKPLSWKLYHTNTPVFVLENVTTHTDVIAYFAPVGDGGDDDGTVTDGGYDPTKDFVTVTVGSTPQGMTQPSGSQQVLKGSLFPVLFKVTTPEYTLRDATVATAGDRATSIAKALTADDASSSTYILKNLAADTNVVATYNQRPEQELVRHGVSADVQIKKDGTVEPLGKGPMPCLIYVESGAAFAQKNIVKNGPGMGVALLEGSDLRFSLTRDEGHSQLDGLGLVWDDPAVKAFRTTEAMADGSVRNVIYFTTDEDDLVGRQVYQSGSPLYADDDAPADVNTDKSWYVSNLLCDITLVPTYERIERPVTPVVSDSWTLTTKVGFGFGQVLVNSADATGCTTKVKKNTVTSDDPLVVSLVPAAGYRIKDLHVSTSTGNPLQDFWAKILGFLNASQGEETGAELEAKLKQQAIDSGSITLLRMVANYDITVDYEVIPGQETPTITLPDHVAVNVKYDPDKGVVTPDAGLVVNRDAEQQFVADPKEVDGAFYSVVGVRVSVGDGIAQEIRAVDKTSDLVVWDDEYANVFVVDFSQLAWPDDQPDAAVTVEILFSDEPNTTRPNDPESDDIPGSPANKDRKTVVMNVVTEGDSGTDDNGIGGVVSPRGEFVLVPPKDGEEPYKQRVDVIPGYDYEFSKVVSVVDGDEVDGAWNAYLYQTALKEGKGYFEVEADKPGTEVITVYFKLKPLSERLYSINVEAEIPDADRFIQPHGVMSIENTKSQTYSIDPDLGYQVASITDMAVDENGDDVPLPEGVTGANWTRGPNDTFAVNELRVDPIRVKGKVVNRHVVVAFEEKEGVDHGINKSEKVNLHVKAYGPGSEYLTFDPAGDMMGVFKGTDTKKMSYTYRFTLSPEGKEAGYGIYWVQMNGETKFGAVDNKTDLRPEGSFTFTTENMTRETNNLFVYVKKNPLSNPGPSDPGDNKPPVNPDDPNGPGDDPNNLVTVDYGCGNGGSITDLNPSLRTRAIDTTGGQMSGSLLVNPEEPFVLLITPKTNYVVDKIIMDNCVVIQPNWVAPEDGREAKIALESTMMVKDPTRSARVLATFKKGDADDFDPWDPTIDDGHAYDVDGSLIVEITPADGVEALVELENGTARAADMLDVSNPVAPFTPKTAKKSGASASYTVTYDTVSKLGEEKNVNILVGPLIKWNEDDNDQSILYTLDSVRGLEDGFTVEEKPLPGAAEVTEDGKPAYYSYYAIHGTIDEAAARNVAMADAGEGVDERTVELADNATAPVVRIGLRGLAFDDGVYPEFDANGGGGDGGNDDTDNATKRKVELRAQVQAGQGTIVPTTTTVGTSWYDGNLTGPWTVAQNSTVSFKVEPAADFVLTDLTYNSIDALSNESFDAKTNTLTFRATTSTTVYASFAPKDSADALRTVTIEVQGGHGTTSPAPGKYQVEKGQPYPITFEADDGYVPYRIWVDGQESYIAPTLSGWTLPAWWHDQTFKVEFAVSGTTPSGLNYLVQTGQNVADQVGTALVRTGDNPWLPVVVLLLLIAGGAAFIGMRMVRASESASRAAKYSVTRRKNDEDEE